MKDVRKELCQWPGEMLALTWKEGKKEDGQVRESYKGLLQNSIY